MGDALRSVAVKSRHLSSRFGDEAGFTLSELLLVAVFVVGLISVGFWAANGIVAENRRSNCQTELRNLKMVVGEHHARTGSYPASIDEMVEASEVVEADVDSWEITGGGGEEMPRYQPVLGRC